MFNVSGRILLDVQHSETGLAGRQVGFVPDPLRGLLRLALEPAREKCQYLGSC